MNQPETRYATTSDGVSLAYHTIGDGPVDLIWLHAFMGSLEILWEHEVIRSLSDRFAGFTRLIRHDMRAMGLSGRATSLPDLETQGAFRVRRREQRTHERALESGPEHRAVGAGGVHHRSDVVHPDLERGHAGDGIRQPGPSLVEHEEATVGRKVDDVTDEKGLVPGRQQVTHGSPDEDEIGRTLSDHLVRDADVSALRVPDVGDRRHERILRRLPHGLQPGVR